MMNNTLFIGDNYLKASLRCFQALFFILSLSVCADSYAQAPANDDCSGAIPITVNSNLTCTSVTSGTTVNATESMAAAPCSGTPNDDVWFSFVAQSTTQQITISNVVAVQGTSTDMYFQVLDGTCGSTTSLLCSDPNSNLASGLTVGNTYLLRVYSYYTSSRQTFDVCIGSLPAAPANDNCANAIALTVNPDTSCANVTAGTTAGASQSMEAAPCNGTPDDDVWFSFVATAVAHTITISDITAVAGTSTDMYFQVLSGTCGNTVSKACSDPNSLSVGGLTIGEAYFVRVYSYGSSSVNNFNICVSTPPAGPANDECAAAVALTVNNDLSCTNVTAGTTLNASYTMAPAPCYGNPNDDVWYSFVATSTVHNVTLSDITAVAGTSTDMYFQVLSGSCGNTNSLLCSDPNTNNVGGLTIGETYLVRVYSYGTTSSQTFNICIGTPPPPPANDECSGAVALTVNSDLSCTNITSGTTQYASQSMAADPCYGTPNDDVWYSFVATATSHQIKLSNVTAVSGSGTDMYFQVLSGSCGATTSLLCSDPNINTAQGLTVGETYLIRVYSYGSTSSQTFDICVGSFPPPPANDDCSGAIALTVNPDLTCTNSTQATTAGATQSMAADPCYGTPDDDVWFSFVATNNAHTITISDVAAVIGSSTDMYFQVLSGSCGTTTSLLCSDPNSAIASGLTTGNTYYVRVYSYGATSMDTFTICVGTPPPPPVNDDCTGAIAITVNDDLECTNTIAGTTLSATESMEADPCSGNPDDDVWFSFVAGATSHLITLSDVEAMIGTSTDMYFQVLSGSCGNFSSLLCSDADSNTVNGLTIGETYYLRVYSYGSSSNQNFTICIGTFPPPPANDECANAIALTVGLDFESAAVATTNAGASHNDDDETPSCDAYNFDTNGKDIWFTVVVPPTGELTLETRSNGDEDIEDTGLAAYTGTCGDLTSLECDADDGEGNFSLLELSDLDPGSVIYVRTWGYNGVFGAFDIAAYAEPCDVEAPDGEMTQDLLLGETLADLEVDGDNLTWYSDAELTNEIPDTTTAVDGATYYVTQTEVACESDALAVTVTVTDPCAGVTAPTGDTEQELSLGQTLADLEVEGDNLTWYTDAELTTEVDATTVAVDGATYYVTQTVATCISEALAITVTVTDPCAGITVPVGDTEQDFTAGQTLADLDVTGDNLMWYTDAELTNALPETTVLVDGTTYYVTQTVGECASEALAVTANLVLNRDDFAADKFRYYPNPVISTLTISGQNQIEDVSVFNMLGQEVYSNSFNADEVELDLSQLSEGNYMVRIKTANAVKTIKIIKN
ncbi:T9SS type A sorting domain-containing protein [Flavobacterium rhizosphaerae]|uniref:T9SS type A sorting domain-containing protein n=1 Tax=Flavobacterium rhizosphaerae TaxID=3163298 RepID=A0ABW8YRC1_9FLAO